MPARALSINPHAMNAGHLGKRFGFVLFFSAVAACDAGADEPSARMQLSSPDIRQGQPIPVVHSCDGANQPPALSWSDPPASTKSLVLVMDDPDAGSDPYHHWGIYDLPASVRSIAAAASPGKKAMNDGREMGYTGPCPPKGDAPHHYHFKLYALDVAALPVPAAARIDTVEAEAKRHAIGRAELTATYQRE